MCFSIVLRLCCGALCQMLHFGAYQHVFKPCPIPFYLGQRCTEHCHIVRLAADILL